MPAAPFPPDEAERYRSLLRYGVLDTPAEGAFDRITQLAARIFAVPIALISLVDRQRQWFKSACGLDVRQTHRDAAFCAYAILTPSDITEVLDPLNDPRFSDNPLVTGPPGIRYYAGAPLVTPSGYALGSLCLIDTVPRRPLSVDQRAILVDLAQMAITEFELRLARLESDAAVAAARNLESLAAEQVAALAHEIKTPLTVILGYSQMAEQASGDRERVAGYVRHIQNAGRHVLALSTNALDALRAHGGTTPSPDDVSARRALEELVALVEPLATARGMTLAVEAPEGLAVRVDRVRLRQILLNFASNAVKYAGRGTLAFAAVAEESGQIRLSVRDEGPGLMPEDAARVFEAGWRGESAAAQADGHGRGLAVVKALAATMGGDVGVNSEPGRGATFWVRFPAAAG